MSEQTGGRFSADTEQMLREAGWFPGRDVSGKLRLPPRFTPFPAALKVLGEFGGLRVGRRGPGVEFSRTPVVLDPMLCDGEDDRFDALVDLVGCALYPLGETADGHSFLAVDERGRVFLIFGDIHLIADTFEGALENLLHGLKQPRMLNAEGPR